MSTSVFDPPIPYIGAINGPKFSPGNMVKIQGLAPSIGYRFNIHLQCGHKIAPRDDVAIQISVNFLDGYISLNSLQRGVWGDEHRGLLTVKRNEKFEIIVLCDVNQYNIAINGKHYWEFPQRIHTDRITHLAIDGDVSIFKISYESLITNASAPLPTPPGNNEGDDFEMIDSTTNKPSQAGMKPPSSSIGFSEPPPYDAATRAPYPTSGPVGMPNPTDMVMTSHSYPPTGAAGAHLPPIGGLTPLNATTSCYRPVKRDNTRKCALVFCGVFLGIIIIIIVIVSKVLVHKSRYNSDSDNPYYNTYDSNYKNNYGNSYNHYDNNNYGGYNSNNNW